VPAEQGAADLDHLSVVTAVLGVSIVRSSSRRHSGSARMSIATIFPPVKPPNSSTGGRPHGLRREPKSCEPM
jgi:hypothetical protein